LPRPTIGDLSDDDLLFVRHWLAKFADVSFAKDEIHGAIHTAAQSNRVHAVPVT
jgi:hypothetical protein